jgi:WXXGXW repeat (2 copies)
MNYKTLLLIPAALALGAPANAYVRFGLNLGLPLPLYYPAPGYYYPAPVYAQAVTYDGAPGARADQVTPAPGPGYVWIAGHWNNVSQRWVWVAGRWEMPPSPSALWVGGHWVQGSSGWVWVDGAWTIGAASAQPPTPPVAPAGAAANSAPQASEPPPAPPGASVIASPSAPPPPEMADGTVVYDEPPAPIAEYVPAAPYPDYVWIGGFWGWNAGWVWHAGHYGPRPFRGAAWVGGGWVRGGHGWAWHGGRWR